MDLPRNQDSLQVLTRIFLNNGTIVEINLEKKGVYMANSEEKLELEQETQLSSNYFEYQLQCRSGSIQFKIIKRELADHVEYTITIKDIHNSKVENYTLDLNQFGDLKRLMNTLSKLEPHPQMERHRPRNPIRENHFTDFF